MARLQILELPEGSNDDRPPFVLVVDQYEPPRYPADVNDPSPFDGVAEQIGARAVLVFEDTIDIPANDTTAYLDAAAGNNLSPDASEEGGPRCRYCGADCTDGRSWDGGNLYACPACSDWRAKLNLQKASLLDLLGMDRTRDWDDIRNATTGLRKSNEARGEAIDRVLGLPYQPDIMDAQHAEPTGYLHGYRIAIQDAKRAVGHQSEHPTEKQSRA